MDAPSAMDALLSREQDAVPLDLNLPEGDGPSILRDLRKRDPDIPVLIMTARDGVDDRINGLDSEADDYLVKPFKLNKMLAQLLLYLRDKFTIGAFQQGCREAVTLAPVHRPYFRSALD
ncbi:response regulator [Caballeronia sordidicola]|uniref:Two-component system response regulator QseB n=1 Tax=Caballeronia sordidicola TaxID=196367 RepID=A0A242MBC5_CABSO|nr:response regulator [Caballeronia sordidicola]OTP68241.1 Two-component system response regulator QseB [Caballeronia sordidicola]